MIADGTVADASADAGAAVAQAADLTAALMTSDAELTMKISVVYHFFGFLWVLNFVQLVAWLVMSGAVCWWYFLRKDDAHKTRIPILRSLGRTMKYHLGSAAFAALIIAICQFLRAVMEYVDRQTRLYQDKNKVLKLIMKCAKCAMWCIEKTVRFISAYGLVFVALEGRNFCGACFSTFKFIVANPVQVGVNTVVTKLLILLSIGTIPVSCGIATFVVLEQRGIRNPMYSVFMAVLLGDRRDERVHGGLRVRDHLDLRLLLQGPEGARRRAHVAVAPLRLRPAAALPEDRRRRQARHQRHAQKAHRRQGRRRRECARLMMMAARPRPRAKIRRPVHWFPPRHTSRTSRHASKALYTRADFVGAAASSEEAPRLVNALSLRHTRGSPAEPLASPAESPTASLPWTLPSAESSSLPEPAAARGRR